MRPIFRHINTIFLRRVTSSPISIATSADAPQHVGGVSLTDAKHAAHEIIFALLLRQKYLGKRQRQTGKTQK